MIKAIFFFQALQDIQVAIKTLKSEVKDEAINPLDRHYTAMECQLEPVESESDEYKVIRNT